MVFSHVISYHEKSCLLFQTRLAEVESLRQQAEAVEAALQRPQLRSAVALLPPLPAVHECLQQIGVTLHQVGNTHTSWGDKRPPQLLRISNTGPLSPQRSLSGTAASCFCLSTVPGVTSALFWGLLLSGANGVQQHPLWCSSEASGCLSS